MTCPVLNYTLVVEDPEGDITTRTSQATGDIVSITIPGLMENTRYSYHVIATNQFGDSNPSSPVKFGESGYSHLGVHIDYTIFVIAIV